MVDFEDNNFYFRQLKKNNQKLIDFYFRLNRFIFKIEEIDETC